MLLLPDEILRFPLNQALVIIRGQKVLKVEKFDYSRHSDAKKLALEKTEQYMPEWRKREQYTDDRSDSCGKWGGQEEKRGRPEEPVTSEVADRPEDFEKPFEAEKDAAERTSESGQIEKVEDLFTDEW